MEHESQGALARLLLAGTDAIRRERYPQVRAKPPARRAAVLVLFGPVTGQATSLEAAALPPDALDVVLEVRADTLRSHPGEVSFPGGAADPDDADAAATALREAHEEIGVHPDDVEVLRTLTEIPLLASATLVTPVIGWRSRPVPLHPADPAETASVHRVPVAELLDPANRFTSVYRHPQGDFRSPAFQVGTLLVWGFTAMVLDGLFDAAGWALDWDSTRERDI